MIVVSDTTAITSLLKLGEAELLHVIFGEIIVPDAVRAELLSYHSEVPDRLIVRAISDRGTFENLSRQLDPGEAEAITLAKMLEADLLIIDEKRGRIEAEKLGQRCIGLAGVLLLAKERGLIASLRDVIDRLEVKAGFYLSASVKRKLFDAAGETSDL